MDLQREISAAKNEKKIGSLQKTLIEGQYDDLYYGRTSADAPEIDAEIRFTSKKKLDTGSFVDVMVTDAEEFDLIGEVR
jgi:ribosomal protein S12 methylthiotransferase